MNTKQVPTESPRGGSNRPTGFLVLALACTMAVLLASASVAVPLGVSPASELGLADVASRCPSFSWTAVDESTGYELVVVPADESEGAGRTDEPVLRVRLPRGATSWTPNLEQCLVAGERYAWSVRALGPRVGADWSRPSLFRIVPATPALDLEEALDVVRRHLAEADPGSFAGSAAFSGSGGAGGVRPAASAGPVSSSRGGDTGFDVDGSGNVVGSSFTGGTFTGTSFNGGSFAGSGAGLTGIPLSGLGFDTATQAELNTHKGSGDHDSRYLNLSGSAQDVTADVTFRNVNFGLFGGATNLATFEDSAAFHGSTTLGTNSFLRVQGRYEFECTENRNEVRVGDVCMDQFTRGTTNDASAAILACGQARMSLCSLQAIMACDALNVGNSSPTFQTCGTLTDNLLGESRIWTSTTLTNESGSAFSELLVYDGNGNTTTVGGSAGTTTAHYFCCVPVPGD